MRGSSSSTWIDPLAARGRERRASGGRPRFGAAIPLSVRHRRARDCRPSMSPIRSIRAPIDGQSRAARGRAARLSGAHLRLRGGRPAGSGDRRYRAARAHAARISCSTAAARCAMRATSSSPRPTLRCSPMWRTAPDGLKVLQLTSPASQPKFYGFSPGAQAAADRALPHARAGAGAVEGSRPRPRGR